MVVSEPGGAAGAQEEQDPAWRAAGGEVVLGVAAGSGAMGAGGSGAASTHLPVMEADTAGESGSVSGAAATLNSAPPPPAHARAQRPGAGAGAGGAPPPTAGVAAAADEGAELAPAGAAAPRAPPAKRRPGRQKRTSVLCQVPSCGEELVNATKGYYRRYRICQLHCNASSMLLDGRMQRFCQQCGRFQDISDFEGAKKSCKRKLKRHNERRRVDFLRDVEGGEAGEGDGKEGDSEAETTEDGDYPSRQAKGGYDSEVDKKRGPSGRKQPRGARTAAAPPAAKGGGAGGGRAGNGGGNGGRDGDGAERGSKRQRRGAAGVAAAVAAAMARQEEEEEDREQGQGEGEEMEHGGQEDERQAARAAGGRPAGGGGGGSAAAATAAGQGRRTHAPTTRLLSPGQLQLQLQALMGDPHVAAMEVRRSPPTAADHPLGLLPSGGELQLPSPGAAMWELALGGDLGAALASGGAGGGWPRVDLSGGGAPGAVGLQLPGPGPSAPGLASPSAHLQQRRQLQQLLQMPPPPGLLPLGAAGADRGAEGGPGSLFTDIPAAMAGMPADLALALTGAQAYVDAAAASLLPGFDGHHPASAAPAPDMPGGGHGPSLGQGQGQGHGQGGAPRGGGEEGGLYGAAPPGGMVHNPLVPYASDNRLERMSLKVFSCRPEQLLPLVRAELERLLESSPAMMEGYIRPGCTHLTLNLLLTQQQAAALHARGLRQPLERLLSSGALGAVSRCTMVLQVGSQLLIVRGGQVADDVDLSTFHQLPPPPTTSITSTTAAASCLATSACAAADLTAAGCSTDGLPQLYRLDPLCTLAGQPGLVALRGRHITHNDSLVLCRQQGCHLSTELHGSSSDSGSGSGSSESEDDGDDSSNDMDGLDDSDSGLRCGACPGSGALGSNQCHATCVAGIQAMQRDGSSGGSGRAGADPADSVGIQQQPHEQQQRQQQDTLQHAECSAQQPRSCVHAVRHEQPEQSEQPSAGAGIEAWLPCSDSGDAGADAGGMSGEWLHVKPLGTVPGCVEVEVQRGHVLSEPLPLLALPCAAAVAEVCQLALDSTGIVDVSGFLRDTGLVVQYLYRNELAAAGHYTPQYSPPLCRRIADTARRLAAAARARGWPAFVALVSPASTAAAAEAGFEADADVVGAVVAELPAGAVEATQKLASPAPGCLSTSRPEPAAATALVHPVAGAPKAVAPAGLQLAPSCCDMQQQPVEEEKRKQQEPCMPPCPATGGWKGKVGAPCSQAAAAVSTSWLSAATGISPVDTSGCWGGDEGHSGRHAPCALPLS